MSSNQIQDSNSFGSRFGALMSMTGMCVGMGSVWRFPYMVGQYGGGSFIVAFIVCMMIIVLPLAIIECGTGKGHAKGTIGVMTDIFKNGPIGKLVGAVFALGYYSMNFFYYVVLTASVYFIYSCATSEWTRIEPHHIYSNFEQHKIIIALISVILVVATIYTLIKGVSEGIEKLSKIMIPMMFLFFIVVIFFGVFFIDGIQSGYNWYLQPSLKALANPEIWIAALGQALFSIGVGPGCVLIYGSHLKKTSDVTLNMTTVCLLTCSVGIIVGMAMIPACIAMGLDPESGSMLIFVIIPTLLSEIPFGNVIGVLLFIAIFFAGFSTAIAQSEIAVSTFATDLKWGRKKAGYIFGAINIVAAIAAVYSVGWYDFWNNFSGNYLFIISAGIGAIAYIYLQKMEYVRHKFLNASSDIRVGKWFSKYAMFIAAPLMIIVMINSLVPLYRPAEVSYAKEFVEEIMTRPTIITLILIIIFVFGSTCLLLWKCVTTKERTMEDILNYERENGVADE